MGLGQTLGRCGSNGHLCVYMHVQTHAAIIKNIYTYTYIHIYIYIYIYIENAYKALARHIDRWDPNLA